MAISPGAQTTTVRQTEVEVPRWIGQSVPRREDRRLKQRQGEFADDGWMRRQGFAHFVRSLVAHASSIRDRQ